jgi:hypothetical protein
VFRLIQLLTLSVATATVTLSGMSNATATRTLATEPLPSAQAQLSSGTAEGTLIARRTPRTVITRRVCRTQSYRYYGRLRVRQICRVYYR